MGFGSGKGKQSRNRSPVPRERLLMGRQALVELLRHAPERIERIFVVGNAAGKGRDELFDLISEHKLNAETLSIEQLTAMLGSDSHQSFAALLKPRESPSLKQLLELQTDSKQSIFVFLDSINSPHNLGAIIRAGECFSAHAVVWSKDRAAGVSPVVTKTSVGASELVPLCIVGNITEALRRTKEAGYWVVAATEQGDREIGTFDFPARTALILGGEHAGIRRLVLEQADFKVRIPISGKVGSLNVSQAAALFLHSFRIQFPIP